MSNNRQNRSSSRIISIPRKPFASVPTNHIGKYFMTKRRNRTRVVVDTTKGKYSYNDILRKMRVVDCSK